MDRSTLRSSKMVQGRAEHSGRGCGNPAAIEQLQAIRAGPSDRSRRLIALDFDRTIMKMHMWAKYKNADIDSIPISDDSFVDLTRFRALAHSLREAGHQVAIATFGRKDVVSKALNYAFGSAHNITILTPADFGYRDGSGALGDKNTQLAALATRYQVPASNIMLVDDDKRNVAAASHAGVQAQYAPMGLTKTLVNQVITDTGLVPFGTLRAEELAALVTPPVSPQMLPVQSAPVLPRWHTMTMKPLPAHGPAVSKPCAYSPRQTMPLHRSGYSSGLGKAPPAGALITGAPLRSARNGAATVPQWSAMV